MKEKKNSDIFSDNSFLNKGKEKKYVCCVTNITTYKNIRKISYNLTFLFSGGRTSKFWHLREFTSEL